MTRTQLGLAAAVVASALLTPATALGATRHVEKTGADNATCLAASPCLTINHAVSIANVSDTIHIGPGFYDEAVVADDRLHFEGAGAGDPASLFTAGTTRIQPILDDGPALELRDGGTVHDLQLVGKANPSPTARPGLLLTTPGGAGNLAFVVERVNAFGGQTGGGSRAEGIRIDDDGSGQKLTAELRDLVIAPGATDDGGDGLVADGPEVTAELTDVTVRPLSDQVRFPLWSQHGARLELADSAMEPTGTVNVSIQIQEAPGSVLVKRSDLRAHGQVLRVSNGLFGVATAVVDDSVLASASDAPSDPGLTPTAEAANYAGGDVRLFFRNSTVVGHRAQPQALELVASGAGDAHAEATNTIFRATSTTGQADPDVRLVPVNGEASFEPATSSFSEAVVEPTGGAGSGVTPAPGTAGNLTGDPGFADEAGGDLRLGRDATVVDRGDLAEINPGEHDVTGGERVIDGDGDGAALPDLGAYERSFIPGGDGGGNGGGGGGEGSVGEGAATTAAPGGSSPGAEPVRVLRFGLTARRFR